MGTFLYNERRYANKLAVHSSQNAVVTSLLVPAGDWQLRGSCGLAGPPEPSGIKPVHMHASITTNSALPGQPGIETAPGQGGTSAMHLGANHENGYLYPCGWGRRYVFAQETEVRIVVLPQFTNEADGYAYGTIAAYPTPS